MLTVRRLVAVLTAVAALASGSLLLSPVAGANPTVDTVLETLTALAERNGALTERFNASEIQVAEDQKRYDRAHAVSQREYRHFAAMRSQYNVTVVALYRERSVNTASVMLTAGSTMRYLQVVSALESVSRAQQRRLAALDKAQQRYTAAEVAARAALDKATRRRDDLARQRVVLATEQKKALDLISTLTASQRSAFFGGPVAWEPGGTDSLRRQVDAGTNPAGRTAARIALEQLGKPYVWAAAGPKTFDCSGLTLFAWARAGVSLPHLASAQFRIGRHVEPQDLQPGDLVYFYPTIEHVGMYLGHGLMIHAPQTGDVVRVVPLSRFASVYMGATRPNT